MKIVFLFLNFLICFSYLLDQIRKDIINIVLLYLPKRETIDILKLGIEMSKVKEEYSMTEPEIAYFIFEWITQNIQSDCISINKGNSSTDAATTYKEGKGGPIGISELFNTLSSFFNIESNTILGLTKIDTFFNKQVIEVQEHAWNYILIDNKYYLLDATLGGGYCYQKNTFYKKHTDFYFGTTPEIFIRLHFPNDNKWQLLPEIITKDEFKSMVYIYDEFYSLGFRSIYPDKQNFNKDRVKIRLTHYNTIDDFFENYELNYMKSFNDSSMESGTNLNVNKVSNGVYEFIYYPQENVRYDLYVKNRETLRPYNLVTFGN